MTKTSKNDHKNAHVNEPRIGKIAAKQPLSGITVVSTMRVKGEGSSVHVIETKRAS